MSQVDAQQSEAGLIGPDLPCSGHDPNRILMHCPSVGAIQTKLAINKPGDKYEQEADRVAEQVMRMPDRKLQRACSGGEGCPKCRSQQDEQARIQTKPSQGINVGKSTGSPENVIPSPGQPLDSATLAFFEPRFRQDFSKVRVHADRTAAASAHQLGAHAYTVGADIVFGQGRYAPKSPGGRHLLAHELTHVVQQSGAGQTPRVQRWAYGAGNHVTGGGANLSEVTAAERSGSNGFDASMRIVDRVVNNQQCRQWFTDNCTDVPAPTLDDLNNRAVIWMWRIADGAPAGNNGLTDGAADENHAINERLFNLHSRWAMAATMIHEYWHDCETGQPDIGDDAKAACGLPNI